MCSRSNRITNLDHEIHSLNETISTLTRELELKGKEVLRVRSEANQQIRCLLYHCGEYPDLLSFLFIFICVALTCLPLNTKINRVFSRAHEQDLSKRHERDMGELSIVHQRELQIILCDFNKAQEVLKDKISALQIL